MVDLIFLFRHPVSDASYKMLLAPMLALFTITLNFYALFHIASEWNGLSTGGWRTLDRAIHALEGTTVAAYKNYRGVTTLPTSATSLISPIRRAEWVFRSSAVRVLDLVDGSSKVQKAPAAASSPALPPSPTRPMDPVTPANILLPTLTSPVRRATFGSFPTPNHSTPLAATSLVALSLGHAWFISCFMSMLIFVCLKDPRHRSLVYATKPTLDCDIHRLMLGEDFHSVYTDTSIPSYPGTAVDPSQLELGGPLNNPPTPRVGLPTAHRTFPVVFTNSDGIFLFKAEVKLSSNHVLTELSGTSSSVALTEIVASLHIPSLPDPNVLPVEQAPKASPHQLGPDCEVEDTPAGDISPLGSPICPVTIPIHHRGFSAFETALINSGTLKRTADARGENHRHPKNARDNIRPGDPSFVWLREMYTCGGNHLEEGCGCEGLFAEQAIENSHPHPEVLSTIFGGHCANLGTGWDTRSEGRGSGTWNQAHTVSTGLSAQAELLPTNISDLAEPRMAAHFDPSHADGKEITDPDSTVTLMPAFGAVSPGLPLRRTSSGFSSPAESPDDTFGEQGVSSAEDSDVGTGSTSRFPGTSRSANVDWSPPSPVVPTRVGLMMDALEPILRDCASFPSPAALAHPSSAPNHLERSPLEYSPASGRGSPAEHGDTLEYGDWEPTGAAENADFEQILEVKPPFPKEATAPSTPRRLR